MNSESAIDCKIWSQFKSGDKQAFARIYQLHSISLIAYGSKICQDQDLLKDTIQDLFIELWNSRENLAQVDSIRFYLLKALRYKLVRSEKKRHQQDPFSTIAGENNFNRFEMPVETTIIEKEVLDSQINTLRKAIKSLSRRQQEVIQLRFYQGFSNEQIADLMNMNYQSVSNLLYSALTRIKKNLKPAVFASGLAAIMYLFF